MSSTSSNGNCAATRSPAALSWLPPPANSKETSETLELIEELTTNVDAVQERVLAEILSRNADSEYLAVRCGLAGGAADRATFRAKVPTVTYEDVKPYILRIANGDKSPILSGSGNPISELARSSGTSGGELKLIPVVKDEHDRTNVTRSLAMAALSRDVPGLDEGSALYLYFVRPDTTTPGGLPARPTMTSTLKRMFSGNELPYDPHRSYTSPPAAMLCEDVSQSMYAHMLCGLCHRLAVVRVGAVFAFVVVRAVRFLQLHWRQLAADIEAGALLTQRVTDPSVREAVAGVLRPDPELARFVRAECGKADWGGIVTRIWPNAKCLQTIVTGSMAQYVPALNHYTGGLPIASTTYASSECCFGINLRPSCDPRDVSYTILPNMAYFEFLPVTDDGDRQQLVELAGVEAGRDYEVVVTTFAGLCRYRVGDVLRVTGFHNAAPQFRFVRRKSVVLSLEADKTEEAELQQAVERASSRLLQPHGAAVLDYTSRTCTESIPGHYVVYWELRRRSESVAVDGDVLARCCLEMEEALNYLYRRFRVADGSIGPLEIRVVQPGTFQELADYAVSHGGASLVQYKVPRCVTVPPIIHLLDSRVVSSHYSPALPHWAPSLSSII